MRNTTHTLGSALEYLTTGQSQSIFQDLDASVLLSQLTDSDAVIIESPSYREEHVEGYSLVLRGDQFEGLFFVLQGAVSLYTRLKESRHKPHGRLAPQA